MAQKKADWPIIKKRVYPTGNVAWVVDCGMVDGKRPRFNAHETAEQMGHVGGLRVFFRHYRNRVREEAARGYWAIRPAASLQGVKAV
jgi:hypothetical protein